MPNFSELKTPGGYVVGEVTSALQKEIRRGNEAGAMFWASELDLQKLGNYVWKRLKIIASEDVGMADPMVAVQVRMLYENWREEKPKTKPGYEGFVRIFILHAVSILARAPKSRMLDHALMAIYGEPRERPKIPDYALDQHTRRGKQMGRGMKHFLEVGSQLANEGGVYDPYEKEGKRKVLAPKQPARSGASQLEIE